MSFSGYPTAAPLVSVSNGSFTGAAGTAIDTSLRNLGNTLTSRAYDVKIQFGAVGNGSTDDTTAIQNAINAAYVAGGGTVFLPPGIYKVSNLSWHFEVSIVGSGRSAIGDSPCILRGSASGSMLTATTGSGNGSVPTVSVIASGYLSNFEIDGNSLATVGLDMTGLHQAHFDNLYIRRCTTGIRMRGPVAVYFDRCLLWQCGTGVDADWGISNTVQANLCGFTNCTFAYCTTLCVNWAHGASVQFLTCNFEQNGTSGNSATGCIKSANMNPNAEGIGLVLNGCWFEGNAGGFIISVGTSSNGSCWDCTVRDTLFGYAPVSGTAATDGIKIDGSSGTTTNLYMDGSHMLASAYATNSVNLAGTNAHLYKNSSFVPTAAGTGATHTVTYT